LLAAAWTQSLVLTGQYACPDDAERMPRGSYINWNVVVLFAAAKHHDRCDVRLVWWHRARRVAVPSTTRPVAAKSRVEDWPQGSHRPPATCEAAYRHWLVVEDRPCRWSSSIGAAGVLRSQPGNAYVLDVRIPMQASIIRIRVTNAARDVALDGANNPERYDKSVSESHSGFRQRRPGENRGLNSARAARRDSGALAARDTTRRSCQIRGQGAADAKVCPIQVARAQASTLDAETWTLSHGFADTSARIIFRCCACRSFAAARLRKPTTAQAGKS
jgi:hypothetical protein